MKPANNKPALLRQLEDLDSLLDHVHPFIHTLKGFYRMIRLYSEEAENLLPAIISVKKEWSAKLPFDNAIDRAVDWEEWSKKLDVSRCTPLFQQWSALKSQFDTPDNADYVRKIELSLKQLMGTMTQLSVELDAVNDLLKSLAPRKLYQYYKEKERECEGSQIKEDIHTGITKICITNRCCNPNLLRWVSVPTDAMMQKVFGSPFMRERLRSTNPSWANTSSSTAGN